MKHLRLAKDLTLPTDVITQTILIVGKRGSGKSNTAARLVEQLHHARLPFVVLDPVDTWWGLKAGRDGEKGLDVYVFGGRRADLPLEAGGGALIAEVLCEHRLSMVLSVKHLSGRERSTFMVAFAQTLFQKWAGGPLCVVLEEAHELAPQSAQNGREGEQQMLGAFKRLWKLGRASGIGGVAITQRPASLSKDITTQSEILIAHRTIGPQDVKAVGEWVKYHGERLDILAELPTLPTGEAFVWAPEFPEGKPIGLQRTSILLRETYDSASTPKVGEQRVEPKELAEVDLERLRLKMAATIEKAKADDPRELRKQIANLRAEVASLNGRKPEAPKQNTGKVIEKPVLTDADRTLLDKVGSKIAEVQRLLTVNSGFDVTDLLTEIDRRVKRFAQDLHAEQSDARDAFVAILDGKGFQKILGKLATVESFDPNARVHMQPRQVLVTRPVVTPRRAEPRAEARPVTEGEIRGGKFRAMLVALAQAGRPLSDSQIAARAVMALSGTFDKYLGQMRANGWVDGARTALTITAAGLASLGDYDALPTGVALQEHWLSKMGGGKKRAMLYALIDAYPTAQSDEWVAEHAQMALSGTFDKYLGQLRALQLVEGPRTALRASEELFS